MIRISQPNDAECVVPLLYSAIGDIALLLTGTERAADAMDLMHGWYRSAGNRLSFENVLVEVREGIPVGAALMYEGRRSAQLDAPLLEQARHRLGDRQLTFPKESRDDEFYLDSLAVAPSAQGQGVGTALMQAFEAEARRLGYQKAALIVDLGNERARRLYDLQGYEADGQLVILGHMYEHRVKKV